MSRPEGGGRIPSSPPAVPHRLARRPGHGAPPFRRPALPAGSGEAALDLLRLEKERGVRAASAAE
jgi:hypothetical protein